MITKDKLNSGELALGSWIMINHPSMVELIDQAGFDWMAVDAEHTSTTISEIHSAILAAKNTDLLIRVPEKDSKIVKQVLDAGADGIIFPNISTFEDAKIALKMCHYPPNGNRGASLCRATKFGNNFSEYYHNFDPIVVMMIESDRGIDNLNTILTHLGNNIDAILIGKYDLSADLGVPGELNHRAVTEAVNDIVATCKNFGVSVGVHVTQCDEEPIRYAIRHGMNFIGCSLDTEYIKAGIRKIKNEETMARYRDE